MLEDVNFNVMTLEMDVHAEKITSYDAKPSLKYYSERFKRGESVDERNSNPVPKKLVQTEKISSVEVPYFDMSLSESELSDESEEENVVEPKTIVKVEPRTVINVEPGNDGKCKTPRKAAQAARTVWADLGADDEEAEKATRESGNDPTIEVSSDIKLPKKYDRENIKGLFKKELLISEGNASLRPNESGSESLTVTEATKTISTGEKFTAYEKQDREDEYNSEDFSPTDESQKINDDKDSDFNPENVSCSSGDESAKSALSDFEFEAQCESDPLVSLEGTRYSNFDDALVCLCCGKCHASRSECQMYGSRTNFIPDEVGEDGSTLYDADSMPDVVRFADNDDYSRGVLANSSLEILTRFGPLLAQELMIYTLGFDSNLVDVWLTIEEDERFTAYTTDDTVKSNWLRYVRPANFARSANVMLVTIDKRLYFVTIKPIAPDEELRFWQDEHRNLSRWTVLQTRRGIVKQSCGMTRAKFLSRHHYRVHLIMYHNFRVKGVLRYHNFYCHVCNESCFRKEALTEHCQNKHGVKPWKCPLCSKFIPRSSVVRLHMSQCGKNVESIRYPCTICGKLFVRSFYLKRHVSTVHLGLREFTCEYCGLQFSTDRSVRRHITAVHDGEQPHICEKCGRRFSQSSNLKVHLLTHSGVKPFECTEKDCTAAFTTKQCLQFHYVRVHKYNNDDMPDIRRVVPFTYEDHSIGAGKSRDDFPLSRKNKNRGPRRWSRAAPARDSDDDDEEEEEEGQNGDWNGKTNIRRKKTNGKSGIMKTTRSKRKIKRPIRYVRDELENEEDWLGKEARNVVIKVEMADNEENSVKSNGRKNSMEESVNNSELHVVENDVLNEIVAKSDMNDKSLNSIKNDLISPLKKDNKRRMITRRMKSNKKAKRKRKTR